MKKSTSFALMQLESRALFAADAGMVNDHQELDTGSVSVEAPVAAQSQEPSGFEKFVSGFFRVLGEIIIGGIAADIAGNDPVGAAVMGGVLSGGDIDTAVTAGTTASMNSKK